MRSAVRIRYPPPFQTGKYVSASATAGDERTLHRLEAFSDIVIAFSLSQLAVTLQIPNSKQELFAHPIHVAAFLASFALVCGFWWAHHQLFSKFFVADAVGITLNFAFLACTVLVVYTQQVAMRLSDDTAGFGIYALCFGLAYGLLSVLYVKGLRDPRLSLDASARSWGAQRAFGLGVVALGLLLSSGLAAAHAEPTVVYVSLLAFALVGAAIRLRHRLRERQAAQNR